MRIISQTAVRINYPRLCLQLLERWIIKLLANSEKHAHIHVYTHTHTYAAADDNNVDRIDAPFVVQSPEK